MFEKVPSALFPVRCLIRLYLTIAEELSGDGSTSKKRKLEGEVDGGEGDAVVTDSPGTHQRKELFQKAIDGVSDAFEVSLKLNSAELLALVSCRVFLRSFLLLPSFETVILTLFPL